MNNLTWAEWLSIISVLIALMSLLINLSKFFTDLIDRKEKGKKEEIEKQKAKIVVTSIDDSLIFENKGSADAYIKKITINNTDWEWTTGISKPTLINSEQTKIYNLSIKGMLKIEYTDDYSRNQLGTNITKEYEL